jgi:tRNA-splicing endonuclease subunit Sen15
VFGELFPVPSSPSDHSDLTSSKDTNPSPPFIYIAITTQDASIVYYKLSQGIVKPSV